MLNMILMVREFSIHWVAYKYLSMPSQYLSPKTPKNYYYFWFLKGNMRWLLWTYLVLFLHFLHLRSPVNSFSFPSSMRLCHSDQSSALLQFKNSFSIFNNTFICEFFGMAYYPKWIIGKMAQIVMGGMGSRVIRWQVMWSASTSVAVASKVPSIPIAPFSLFAISRNSISLTTISISPQFHLSLVGLQTWRISTSLILVLLVKSHPKSPTYPNWFHWISLRIITWE